MTQHLRRTLACALVAAVLAGCGGKPEPETAKAPEPARPAAPAAGPAGPAAGPAGPEKPVVLPEGVRAAVLPAGVVATVNGEAVSADEFAGALGVAFTGAQMSYGGRLGVLLDRVDTLLVEKAAREAGVLARPMVARMIERIRRRNAIREVRSRIVGQAKVDDAEVAAAFKEPGDILDMTVLLASTREDADAALARVRGGEDFAAVAKEVSISPGAVAGNVRRPGLERGEGMYPPAVEDAIFALPVGALSEPLETPVGWLVVRVDARRQVSKEEVARLRANLAQSLRMSRANEAVAAAVKGGAVKVLRERYEGKDLPDPDGNPAAVWRALEEIRVAEVDGVLLTMGDVFRDVMDYRLMPRKLPESRDEVYRSLLRQQVDEVRLYTRARAEGLDRHPNVEEAVEGYTRSLLAAQYVADIVLGVEGGNLDQARCRTFFEERRARYLDDERLDLSQILVRREEDARAVMAELAAGGDFAALARSRSVDRSAAAGGRIVWGREDSLAAIFGKEGAAALVQRGRDRRVGEVLLRTTSGYHVVRVHGLRGVGEGDLDEVRERVTADFLGYCQQEAVAKRREKLRAEAVVVIDEAKVREIAPAAPPAGSGIQPHGGTGRSGGASPHGGMGGASGASPHGGMPARGVSPHGAGGPAARP